MIEDYSRPRRSDRKKLEKRKKRGFGRVLLAVFMLLLVITATAAAAAGWYFLVRPDHAIAPGRAVEVEIARGSNTDQIARTMSDAGVVRNALVFRYRARESGLDEILKPGKYAMKTGMSDEAVLQQLRKGPNIVYYEVSIPEGFTVEQIAARFASKTGASEAEFLSLAKTGAARFAADHPYLAQAYGGSLEGYLFPKTYRIKKGTGCERIIEMMLDQFDAETAKIDLGYAQSKGLDLSEVVILASAIEREARLAKDYPLVSSVIYNRLDIGMRLQLCSTVLYFLPPGTKTVSESDLKIDNPFNTYIHPGLPPGPIANPGSTSLKAAAAPAKTKYLYYVLTGKDGSHTFATSYADFLKAKQRYHQTFGVPSP